jgi:hypothetical protein
MQDYTHTYATVLYYIAIGLHPSRKSIFWTFLLRSGGRSDTSEHIPKDENYGALPNVASSATAGLYLIG